MIRNFRSRGKNKPTYDSQKYIVKCQVADLKARGVDPLEHFSNEEVIEKTRAIYKMDNKVAADVAKKYEGLMEQYGGRLTPAEDGEVPFVRQGLEQKSMQSDKESRKAEKAAAKKRRAAEKAATKQARADAKMKAKAHKAAVKNEKVSKTHSTQVAVSQIVIEQIPEASVEEEVPQKETASVSTKKNKSKRGSQRGLASLMTKISQKETALVIVGGGAAALGYRFYSDTSVARRNDQYRSIMSGQDDDDDFDDDDFDDDDDDY